MNPAEVALRLKSFATEDLGFDLVGIASADPMQTYPMFEKWLHNGLNASMGYMADHEDARRSLEAILPGAASVIVVGKVYHHESPLAKATPRIARYAWGRDYHPWMKKRLTRLGQRLETLASANVAWRACVDTAPILERELAQRAGIAWQAKNTMAINTQRGSYFFLGELVTNALLPADAPAVNRCGTCRRCLDACPTAAFPEPYVLDSNRCIAMWTIEHRGAFSEATPDLAGYAFGCDICQEVCPWNRKAPFASDEAFAPLPWIASGEWQDRARAGDPAALHGSSLKRAGLEGLKRNLNRANKKFSGDSDSQSVDRFNGP